MEILSPRSLKLANWLLLAVLVVLGYLGQGRPFALGVLAGGLLVVLNFHWLHHNLRGLFERAAQLPEGQRGPAKVFFAARQLTRFFVLLACIYFLLRQEWVNVVGLVIGLSTTVLTLMLAALIEVIKLIIKKEANPSHGTSHPIS
jgi:hypothetical protein|uniref:ATP synthase subunit I n=1 Tax=Desulfobacca acetoxidans TaxID=60893 RepID=A0A7C5AME6_9BACT